jgi:hypothetical protein
MEDFQVIEAIRRRLNGIEHELLADPPTTARQFAAAMLEVASEMIRTYAEPQAPAGSLADALKTLAAPKPQAHRETPTSARRS